MVGIDVSHHNNRIDWERLEYHFCIIKATEGRTYTDPELLNNFAQAFTRTKLIGFYHYARPENNTPKEEARHFVAKVQPIIEHYDFMPLLALDFEGTAVTWETVNTRISWINNFLDTVETMTGIRPLVYMSSSVARNHSALWEYSKNRLWIAHYNVVVPLEPFNTRAYIWQCADTVQNTVKIDYNQLLIIPEEWQEKQTVDTEKIKRLCSNAMELIGNVLEML